MIEVKANFPWSISGARLAKGVEAVRRMEAALNSEEFKRRVLTALMTETNGLPKAVVYDKIMSGDCLFTPEDGAMQFRVSLYSTWKWFSKVIGYTLGDSNTIYTNAGFFDRASPAELAGHWAHEASHLMGFSHNGAHQTSVPYVVGNIVAELAGEMG